LVGLAFGCKNDEKVIKDCIQKAKDENAKLQHEVNALKQQKENLEKKRDFNYCDLNKKVTEHYINVTSKK